MADASLFFTQTKLTMFNKSGDAKPDADGYYDLILGGLNVHNNSKAWYYTAEGVRELFGPGSLLHRKIANGCLRAEVNHPKQQPTEKLEKFYERFMDIDLNNVCAHIKDVWLDEKFGKEHPEYNNPDLIAIRAKVKPSGLKGQILKDSLENKHENVCFSIRSLADEQYVRGKRIRKIIEIITFDFVNEGGIVMASKWDSPATESMEHQVPLIPAVMKKIAKPASSHTFALESSQVAQYVLGKYFPEPQKSIYSKW